jgi:DNA-directed RNA polymerase specialized sigma24 family protein
MNDKTKIKTKGIKGPAAMMCLIGDRTTNHIEYQRVINVFHKKYIGYIYTIVKNSMSGSYFTQDDIKSVTHNAFIKVIGTASRFKVKSGSSNQEQETQLKAWIGTITRNSQKDYLRALDKVHMHTQYVESFLDEKDLDEKELDEKDMDQSGLVFSALAYASETEPEEEPPNELVRLTQQYMAKIKPANKAVTEAYVQFGDSKGTLPVYVRDGLCREYGLLPDQLRFIKRNTLDGLKKYLQKKVPSLVKDDENDKDDEPG